MKIVVSRRAVVSTVFSSGSQPRVGRIARKNMLRAWRMYEQPGPYITGGEIHIPLYVSESLGP